MRLPLTVVDRRTRDGRTRDRRARDRLVCRSARGPGAELVIQRERLTERFALMQSELGGLFYEMAIRDHVRMDVLIDKAAALQRVDAELAQVEHLLMRVTSRPEASAPAAAHPTRVERRSARNAPRS